MKQKRRIAWHTIQSAIPDARLRPFVRCFAQREISAQTSTVVESTMASLEHIASFCLSGQPTVDYYSGARTVVPHVHFFGTQTRSLGYFSFRGVVLAFGIFLKPFAPWQLFRIPPAEFTDQNFEGREVFGPWVTGLWQKLGECESFRDRVKLRTETLLPFAERAAGQTATDGCRAKPS